MASQGWENGPAPETAANGWTPGPATASALAQPDFRTEVKASDTPGLLAQIGSVQPNIALGATKGLAKTAVNLGELTLKAPIIGHLLMALNEKMYGLTPDQQLAAFGVAREQLAPTNPAQKVGQFGEQAAEYLIPGMEAEKWATALGQILPKATPALIAHLVPKVATEAAIGGSVAKAQGNDSTATALMAGAMPIVGKAGTTAAQFIGSKAEPLVLAAVKPTVTQMKQQAGASLTGISAQASQLAQFIVKNRLTSPEKAQAIIDGAERELNSVLAVKNPVTEAPKRVMRYLDALARSAAKQALPAEDVATIRAAGQDLLASSPLSEDVTTMVSKPSKILGPNGQPVMTPQPVTTRALRTDVTAREALDTARATSKWANRKAYGELKGAATEATKATERGLRDEVKTVVPETRPILRREGQAITARNALDRMRMRTANRDALSLPSHVIAAGELASGKLPFLALAANWLRNNQMKAGIYADKLAIAIRRNDVQAVSSIMGRLGVQLGAEATAP